MTMLLCAWRAAHVGATLVKECLLKELADKTRIMVLHQMQYINHADFIAVVDHGKVIHFGTLEQLKTAGVDFSEYFTAEVSETESADGEDAAPEAASSKDEKEEAENADGAGKLTTAEDREVGIVRGRVYRAYAKALGSPACAFILLAFVFTHVSRMLSGWWLSKWASEMASADPVHTVWYYLWIYTAVCSFQVSHGWRCHLDALIIFFIDNHS